MSSNQVSIYRKLSVITVTFTLLWFSLFSAITQAQNSNLANLFDEEPQFLKESEAFIFDFSQRGDKLELRWQIADGYYLYKKQFKTVTKNATIGEPKFPAATQIEDEFFGISDVFFNQISITYPIIESIKDGVVKIRYQGCAEAGLCYPPTTKVVYLNAVNSSSELVNNSNQTDALQQKDDRQNTSKNTAQTKNSTPVSQQYSLADRLVSTESLTLTLLAFLALGIGLAFTPCVFPMYPILSSIVLGQKNTLKTSQAFMLSFVYVQGMAITYSILGLVVASAGVQFQAALQNPYLLSFFIVAFVFLAIAMFGAYEIQLPSKWQEKLNNLSNQQKGGNLFGVFLMGVISGLIASPCTTAPLTAILLFIAQSGDLILGFTALYVLSLGMGIPLILFGMTGGKLLPKAGNWMNVVKATFGFLMLIVAITFIERIIVDPLTNLLWAAVGFALFTYYGTLNQSTPTTLAKGLRNALIYLGLITSFMYGYNTLWQTQTVGNTVTSKVQHSVTHPQFTVVKDLGDLAAKIAAANAAGKSVMVDLYADWCVACKEFEKYTFPDPAVIEALENTAWLQIDLTDNTPTNFAFQEEFDVKGLPTILFFDQQGNEVKQSRVTGFLPADKFAAHVHAIFSDK
jgi:thiol:disulfide interchange protein DsbD